MPGCAKGGPPAPETALEEVRASLRLKARDLLRGDIEAYLAGVAPQARPVEELIARGASMVPLASIDLVLNPPEHVAVDATELRDMPVELVFTYEGVPADNRIRFTITADFEKTGSSWLETKSSATDILPLWASGPVEVRRSPHFLLLFRPGLAGVDQAIALAEEGRSRLLPRVTVAIDEVHVMTLVADSNELRSQLRGEFTELPLAFASSYGATGSFPTDRILTVDLQRVLMAGLSTAEDGRDVSSSQVFQHELGHLALTRYTSASLPSWVSEGAAMYLAEERRVDAWRDPEYRERLRTVSFSQLDEIDPLPGGLYPYANAAVLYLAETFGVDRFWDFYRSFVDLGSAPVPSAANTERLMRRFLGIGPGELDAATRAYIANAAAAVG